VTTPHSEHSTHRRFSFPGLITYLALLSFLVLLTSSIVIFLAPAGRISGQAVWTLLGLDRATWQSLHLSFGVIFVAVVLVHMAFHWQALVHYLRDRVSHHLTLKWEAVVALLVTLWLIASAVFALPPASTLHDLNAHFRQANWAGGPPATETTDQIPATAGGALPEDHLPVPADKACSDCHRGK